MDNPRSSKSPQFTSSENSTGQNFHPIPYYVVVVFTSVLNNDFAQWGTSTCYEYQVRIRVNREASHSVRSPLSRRPSGQIVLQPATAHDVASGFIKNNRANKNCTMCSDFTHFVFNVHWIELNWKRSLLTNWIATWSAELHRLLHVHYIEKHDIN